MRSLLQLLLLLVLWICAYRAMASPGDKLDEFEDCIYQCHQVACHGTPYLVTKDHEQVVAPAWENRRFEPNWLFESHLTWPLRLLLWNCASNCDYSCQRIITQERKDRNEEIYQFHGKWPFLRVWGIQEFVSVVFSLGNFVPHFLGYLKIARAAAAPLPRAKLLGRSYANLKFMSLVTQMAWVFSTIFHIRDFDVTEKLDYFFAGLTVLSGFYGIGFRYFKLYLPTRRHLGLAFTLLCVSAYAGHIYRLVTDWLYTYNMRANIVVGVLQNVIWGLSCYSLYTKYYQRESEGLVNLKHLNYIQPGRTILSSFYQKSPKLYSLYPLLMCFIVICGMALEIFDFPPVFFDLVDAHSLWHLVTIVPPVMGWYDWLVWDVNENIYEDMKQAVDKKEQ